MVAAAAVGGSARRIAAKAALERDRLDPLVQFQRGIERRTGATIGDELDGVEQAAAPDVADMAVVAEALGQPPLELSSENPDPVEQLLIIDHPLHLERRRAGQRVRQIGMAVLE